MVMTAASDNNINNIGSRRRSSRRQTVEEELWLLRSRSFVKSESFRLNSLSPRYSRTNHSDEDCNNNRSSSRRWRRRIRRGDEKNHNFVERMRDAARNARVFQLRIAGRRGWWPTMMHSSSARIAVAAESHVQRRHDHDVNELKIQFEKITKKKNSDGSKNTPKQEFVKSTPWKNKNSSSNDARDASAALDQCSDVDTVKSCSTISGDVVKTAADDGTEVAENNNIDMEEDEKKKKKKQNIVAAAVATTSVSSLGVALAIILL